MFDFFCFVALYFLRSHYTQFTEVSMLIAPYYGTGYLFQMSSIPTFLYNVNKLHMQPVTLDKG